MAGVVTTTAARAARGTRSPRLHAGNCRSLNARASAVSVAALAVMGMAAWGCGAGAPLLHPAHPLPKGSVAAGSGVSAHFPPPDVTRSIDQASALAVSGGASSESEDAELVAGALAQTLSTPGLAPWFSVRVGVLDSSEAGLSYTGRRARADLRYAFVMDQTALSVGGGITGLMPDLGSYPPTDTCEDPAYCPDPIVNDSNSEIPGFDGGSVSGWGLDLPVLVGWRSDPALIAVWGGVRPRFEDMSGEFRFDTSEGPRAARASGSRWVFQGVLGFALGIKPIWALFELSPAFERLSGTVQLQPAPIAAELEGFSISPAVALLYTP